MSRRWKGIYGGDFQPSLPVRAGPRAAIIGIRSWETSQESEPGQPLGQEIGNWEQARSQTKDLSQSSQKKKCLSPHSLAPPFPSY